MEKKKKKNGSREREGGRKFLIIKKTPTISVFTVVEESTAPGRMQW